MRNPFPLQWPTGWHRTPDDQRAHSRFAYGFSASMSSLLDELRLLGAVDIVITSNLPTRPNGLPYANGSGLTDPGVAVWFIHNGHEQVIANDKWHTPEENMRGIALTVKALRGIERWGATDLVSHAIRGFAALPSGDRDWREVLDVCAYLAPDADDARRQEVLKLARDRYRAMAKLAHSDVGGSTERMTELNRAIEQAEFEIFPPPCAKTGRVCWGHAHGVNTAAPCSMGESS